MSMSLMRAKYKRKRMLPLVVWSFAIWIWAAAFNSPVAAQISTSAPAPADQQAQLDKGRQVMGQVCVACHTNILKMVQVQKESPEQWKETVYSMIGRGAQVMPDEIAPLTAFLAANATSNRGAVTQASTSGPAGRGRAAEQTPETEGRAILQRTCQQCHDMATASTKLPSEDWNAVITKMTTYGAKLTPADQQKLVGYLQSLGK